MKLKPLSKINLGLNIVERRPDGYHNLETLFYPIGLTDELSITESEGPKNCCSFTTNKNFPEGDENNLVVKAHRLICSFYEIPCVNIHLEKKIPSGAGLGGGSSDAAYTLVGLNELFDLGISIQQLKEMASSIGADCPFFIESTPSFGEGIGEILTPANINLSNYNIVIVKPEVNVPTREAFSKIRPAKPTISIRDIMRNPIETWKENLRNDFEESIFPLHPEIGLIKEKMYAMGAIYSSMSGSGASVFGIFKEHLHELEKKFCDCFTWQST